jgi:hypothetical protein
MSPISLTLGRAVPAAKQREKRIVAALSAMIARITEAQQARADRVVRPYLARVSKDDLAVLGFSPLEIARIKSERHPPVVWWV